MSARPPKRAAIVWLHPAAPPKPPPGAPCNGCGVCCAWRPCPLGIMLSRRHRGACAMLRWDATTARYRCGALPAQPAGAGPPRRMLAAGLRSLVARWIAAGQGCDCDVEVARARHS